MKERTFISHHRKWLTIIAVLLLFLSALHYTVPVTKWQYHLLLMQSYFIPILLAAFQFGIKGGLGAALTVTAFYLPHVMLQWGGLIEGNLMRFLQIILFHVIGYLTGLKAQREKEEKIRYQETAEKLEHSIQALKTQSGQLEEMEEQLRQADRLAVIGEMTASLAHELRNPLGSIRGVVDILKDELPEKGKVREFLEILGQETNRMNVVLENYLNFAKTQHHPQTHFELTPIIEKIERLLASRARKSKVELMLHIPDKKIVLYGDYQKLQQVLINLLINGIQAIQDKGRLSMEVQLPVTAGSGDFDSSINGSQNIQTVRLKISDDGCGIPAGEIKKIFQPFYSTKKNGTGLGLAIVKRIVEQNQWQLDVESKADKGTTFYLSLPVTKIKDAS
jgi:signal transduction histidine kinase